MKPDARTYHGWRALAIPAMLAALAPCVSACRPVYASTMASAPPLPPTLLGTLKPFFIPGETITWSVSLAGVSGGRARLAVGRVTTIDGHRLVVAHAEAESAGIMNMVREAHDTVASWIDVDSGMPTRTESESTSRNKALVVHAARVGGRPLAELRVWRRKSADRTEQLSRTQRLPTVQTHDPLSAVLALRAWTAPRGARAVLYSLGGARLWRTVLTVEGKDTIRSALGPRAAVRIAGVATRLKPTLQADNKPPRRFTVWVTDDEQRIPIEIRAHTEYGDVVAKATSYVLGE